MTGLFRRTRAAVRDWLGAAAAAVLGLLRGVVRVVRTVTVRVVGHATAALVAIRDRHRERPARDASCRTAIATRLSALLVTITPQPAVTAALAVTVSEHLGAPRPSLGVGYGYDDEDDAYEAYDARRAWSTTPSSRPQQRLWTRLAD